MESRLGRVCRDAAKTSPNLPQHLSARALHKQAAFTQTATPETCRPRSSAQVIT